MTVLALSETIDCSGIEHNGLATFKALQRRPKPDPKALELAVIGCERGDHIAQTDRVGAGHRLDQGRKQIDFFIVVMVPCGGVEITQGTGGGNTCVGIGTMPAHMPGQALQASCLLLKSQMAGGKHFEWYFKTRAWARESGKFGCHR